MEAFGENNIMTAKLKLSDLRIRILCKYDRGNYLEVYLVDPFNCGDNTRNNRMGVCNMFYNTNTKRVNVKHSIDNTIDWQGFYDEYVYKGGKIEDVKVL